MRARRKSRWHGTMRRPRRARAAFSLILLGLAVRASGLRWAAETASRALCVVHPPILLQSWPARTRLASDVGQVGEEYDIIEFDPRGIGQTECALVSLTRDTYTMLTCRTDTRIS